MTDLIGRLDELLLLVDSQVELVNIKEQECVSVGQNVSYGSVNTQLYLRLNGGWYDFF